MNLINTAFPGTRQLTTRHPGAVKTFGPGWCVGEELSHALNSAHALAVNVSSDLDVPLVHRLDGQAWVAVPNDAWFGLIQEAAAVVVGAPLPIDEARVVLSRLLRRATPERAAHRLHRFPAGDLVFFTDDATMRAFRSNGTARQDGIDFDWSDVNANAGNVYQPHGAPLTHPVFRAVNDVRVIEACRQCFSVPSFLDPILVAGEAKALRDTAEAAIEDAPIAAPTRRRL